MTAPRPYRGKDYSVIDLFGALGISCGLAIPQERLSEAVWTTEDLIEDAIIDVNDTVKAYLEKYMGKNRDELLANQTPQMMTELVQLIALRQHRGIQPTELEYDLGGLLFEDDVFLVAT